jgi:hypothetical protein
VLYARRDGVRVRVQPYASTFNVWCKAGKLCSCGCVLGGV